MSSSKIFALVLIAAGLLGLGYGSFSYTQQTHRATLGSLEFSTAERKTVNVPIWVGIGAIVVGGVLFVLGGRKN